MVQLGTVDKEARYRVFTGDSQSRMKLPIGAYSAEVTTSATKAGSYWVFGKGE